MRFDVVLIDGSSQVYRGFYALGTLTTSDGKPTGAIYGFVSILRKILDFVKPKYVAVAWDEKPVRRLKVYPQYKAQREEAPSDLKYQIPYIKKIVEAFRIASFSAPGYEADDVIATLIERIIQDKPDVKILVVTSDKDLMQLVSEKVTVYDPRAEKYYDRNGVKEKYGVSPEFIPDYLALKGDESDNIPGVPGIGDKRAQMLVEKLGGIEKIFNSPGELEPSLRALLAGRREQASRAKKLLLVEKDVPLEFKLDDLKMKECDWETLIPIFRDLEFISFLKEVPRLKGDVPQAEYKTIKTDDELTELIESIKKVGKVSIDTETTSENPQEAELVGISLCSDECKAYYIPVGHKGVKQPEISRVIKLLKPVFEDPSIEKYGQNIKYDIEVLKKYGVEIEGVSFDTMVASYLVAPDRGQYGLDINSLLYLGYKPTSYSEVTSGARISFSKVSVDVATQYSCEDSHLVWLLKPKLEEKINSLRLTSLFEEIEMPLVKVLSDMETVGVKVNIGMLREYSAHLKMEAEQVKKKIWREANTPFNVDSPHQLRAILFEKLKLPYIKKTRKTGAYSTDSEVLEELAQRYEIAALVLEYRTLTKLKSTYVDAIPRLVNIRTGRVHTSFNQARTATGRLSSSEPNLQNIPARGEEGSKIREAFCAEKEHLLISADYSQIELRVMAHISDDDELKKAFLEGRDIHSAVAFSLFGEETQDARRKAKVVNFGVAYGISAQGLSRQLKISENEARKIIESYFQRYKGVKSWIDEVISEAERKGYVRTLSGRIRFIPQLKSKDPHERGEGVRRAINTPIQGSAADIIKMAMIKVWKRLKSTRSNMILQVHDEIIVETPEDEIDSVAKIMQEEMESACELSVPLKVDVKVGKTWADV